MSIIGNCLIALMLFYNLVNHENNIILQINQAIKYFYTFALFFVFLFLVLKEIFYQKIYYIIASLLVSFSMRTNS